MFQVFQDLPSSIDHSWISSLFKSTPKVKEEMP
jgi:hypothetical protein